MDKFEYIRKQFSKSNRKSFELYITTRLWNKLDRLDIEFITQQLVKTNDNKRYFTDVYFPQIKLHIEIDEGYHYNFSQKVLDKIREKDIINITKHRIERINAMQPIELINERIDELVSIINKLINDLGDKFEPWEFREKPSSYYIEKGFIDCKDDISFRTMMDACNCFGRKYEGMQRSNIPHPILNDHRLWFPKLYENKDWDNNILGDDSVIYEKCKKSAEEAKAHLKRDTEDKRNKRLVFAQVKDVFGKYRYRFKGVYQIDVKESLEKNCCVYKKISDIAKTYAQRN